MMTDDGRAARRRARRAPDLRCRAGAPRPARGPAAAGPDGSAFRIEEDGGFGVAVLRAGGDTAVAAVYGEIDLRTADALRGRLIELHAAGHRNLVVDFAGVAFCDAAGLGALVAAHNRAAAAGGGVRLAGVRPPQRRLLRVTGLHRVFGLYDGVEDALAAAAAAAR
ncbi:STAS domain-containing protein [Spirillospora sp. NPDC029432]|uniref:STAS domain-containing protein n=1 Tax=Spirillospora sp. NPDC029432 TaxID=3154599 RepID=UPI003451616A